MGIGLILVVRDRIARPARSTLAGAGEPRRACGRCVSATMRSRACVADDWIAALAIAVEPGRWSVHGSPADRRAHLGPRQQPPGAHRRDRRTALDARIAVVISNRAGRRRARARARRRHSETLVIDHRDLRVARRIRSRAGRSELRARQRRAGLPRRLHAPGRARRCSTRFPTRFSTSTRRCCRRFPASTRSVRRSSHGVKVAGATVHLVTGELDGGPIVVQAAVPVRDDDTPRRSSARILIEEHRIYPEAVRQSCSTAAGRSRAGDSSVLATLPDARDQPVADARRVVPVALEIARRNASSNSTRRSISAE